MMIWEILVISHESRSESLKELEEELIRQIEPDYKGMVDIRTLVNNGSRTRGYYRNKLLNQSNAEWVSFFDDDDLPTDHYVSGVMQQICAFRNINVVGMTGLITTNGMNPKRFEHSTRYNDWATRAGVYVRPPNHLNPIKASIAKKIGYKDIDHGEDHDYSMRLKRGKVVLHEKFIREPIYIYRYKSNK